VTLSAAAARAPAADIDRQPVIMRRQEQSMNICCPRPISAANQPHVGAAVDRRDRQTD